jgi:RNA polymerase sigma factor (sigma-70 family)
MESLVLKRSPAIAMSHTPNPQESEIVEEARRDPQAFARLYDLYLPRLYAYVAYRLGFGDQESTEDVVADIFLKAIRGLTSFHERRESSFAAWLFRIAHNTVLNYKMQRGVQERWQEATPLDDMVDLSATDPSPEDMLLQSERGSALRKLLLALPLRRQEVITLRFFGELRNHEIASVLGLDERTVASHLLRGLRDMHAGWLREMDGADESGKRSKGGKSGTLAKVENHDG